MLFSYTYVPHSMDKMQQFIDFIFFQVWCKAPQAGKYSLDLFQANPELHEVMTGFHYSDTNIASFFAGHIQRIYQLFGDLTNADIQTWQAWYRANNDVEAICTNATAPLVRYADIQAAHPLIAEQLASLFKGIYDRLGAAALKTKIGHIDDHYTVFTATNRAGKCPFCGISDLLGENHTRREAYDHYLPKALYPFNSVNFHNLVPACHHCNSSYKGRQNPAFTPKDPAGNAVRRRMFYPYSSTNYCITISVKLWQRDIDKLTPEDISLDFGPPVLAEPIETWRDVYAIDERYKAKLCAENDGKYWLVQALDEWDEDGRRPADFMRVLSRQAQRAPFAQCNFLKEPFLKACDVAGLLR